MSDQGDQPAERPEPDPAATTESPTVPESEQPQQLEQPEQPELPGLPPAPEPITPAPEPITPAPEPITPAPEPITPAPDPDVLPTPDPIPTPPPDPTPGPEPVPTPDPLPTPDPVPAPAPDPIPAPDAAAAPEVAAERDPKGTAEPPVTPSTAPPTPAESVATPTPSEPAPDAAPAPEVAAERDPKGTAEPPVTPSTAPPTPAESAPTPHPSAEPIPAAPPYVPSDWGRVDDDGTVWVRTASGERAAGSYPGVTPEEALAYYGRKYDELAGQVGLLEQRMNAAGLAPKDAETPLKHLRTAVSEGHAIGDLDGLNRRLDALDELLVVRRKAADATRSKAREEARSTKERIVAEAESLAETTEWKRSGDQLRSLLAEWKAAPRLDKKSDDALWKRFSTARTAFDKRRRAHFAELDAQRSGAAEVKEKLIAEAESLSGSTDWAPTATRYRELMTQWKAAGRARRDIEDALWARFRSAQDTFFSARSTVFAARDADLQVNLEKKEALLTEAEALVPVTDPKSARAAMRSIHERWEAIGHVPRPARDKVEGRLKRVDDAVRGADESAWRSSNPEARARAEATVAQLQASIASLDEQAAAAKEAGKAGEASTAEAAAAARREWLTEAQKTLTEFS